MHNHGQRDKWSANYLSICKGLVSLSFCIFLLYFLVDWWLQTVTGCFANKSFRQCMKSIHQVKCQFVIMRLNYRIQDHFLLLYAYQLLPIVLSTAETNVGKLTFDVGESTSYVGELTRWRNDRYSIRQHKSGGKGVGI